jgi:nucleotide-binding universal stress UspA family protein
MPRRKTPYRILLPLANPRTARDLVRIGSGLSDGRPTEITALGIVEVPEGVSLSEGATAARTARRLLQRVLDFGDEEGVEIRTMVRINRRAADGVIEAVREQAADLIVFGWGGHGAAAAGLSVFSPTIDAVVRESPCDIAVVKQRGLETCRSILVPVRGGPHAELAFRLALTLGRRFGAQVVVMHVVPRGIGEAAMAREREALDTFIAEHAARRRARPLIVSANAVRAAIVREASNHDLVIMGAAAQSAEGGANGRYLFGSVPEEVVTKAQGTVIVVKTREPLAASTFEELRGEEGTLPAADAFAARATALPTIVDRWFAENTFHAHEFSDIRKLIALKERQGLTISVGLPTLNEEKTIGTVIRRLKDALVDRAPLIDQLLVIDSASQDRSAQIARELGVEVVQHADILPAHGSYRGKGEALWKSLYALDGDIVCWIDTDIRNIQPRFVFGLLGPLLREQRIGYVKGFYQRPIREGVTGAVLAEGGGRVTELMARPLLNLFFPELSGVIQPLAGEYAGRRSLLEQLPFFTGYAVEIGLLVDMLEHAGLSAIGQVDLERRIHRNQPLGNLSQMAFTILQAAMRRLEDRHRLQLLTDLPGSMKLINQDGGRFRLDVREIADSQRPPMRTIPEYVEKRRAKRS